MKEIKIKIKITIKNQKPPRMKMLFGPASAYCILSSCRVASCIV
jgi:hypothetical protein